MTFMAVVEAIALREPSWPRTVVTGCGGALAIVSVTAAARLPAFDPAVWGVTGATALSTLVLVAVVRWLTSRHGVAHSRLVLGWGLGSGLVLGVLWMAEIGFNNLVPPSVSTAGSRSVVDNGTWAIVAVATFAVVVVVTARTRSWRCGVRAGAWSGVGSGLGAGLGGAFLLAFLRGFVERDPLMRAEWLHRAPGTDLATYVTRETMTGVAGHLWILGAAQGVLLSMIAATLTALAVRRIRPARTPD